MTAKRSLALLLSTPLFIVVVLLYTPIAFAAAILISPLIALMDAIDVLNGKESMFWNTMIQFTFVGTLLWMELVGIRPPRWMEF
jgi:hypothetical protein